MRRRHRVHRIHRIHRIHRSTALVVGMLVVLGCSVVPTVAAAASGSAVQLAPMSNAYVFHLPFDGSSAATGCTSPGGGQWQAAAVGSQPAGATQNGQLEEIQSGMDAPPTRTAIWWPIPTAPGSPRCSPPIRWPNRPSTAGTPGMCCGLPVTRHVNDVGFLLKVIADIAARTPVDLRRVYVTGISNGGMMAYAMAAEASDHVAAISSVSGQVELPTIHPTRAVPTMEFHSVDDPIAKCDGVPEHEPQARPVGDGGDRPVGEGRRLRPQPARRARRSSGHRDRSRTARRRHWSPTPTAGPGAEVALWRFTGSGHVWPGSDVQHRPAEDLDPGRRGPRDRPRERQRDHVAVLPALRVARPTADTDDVTGRRP